MNDRCSVERAFITTKLNEYLALTTGCKNPRQLPEQEWNSTNTTNQGRNQLFILGGQFSWTFIRWRHRAFAQAVTDKVLFATFPKMRTFHF